MADNRYILTRIWRDEWFSELPHDAKVFWFYLLTNPSASVCGMFRLSDKFASFDTGIALERLREIKEQFKQEGKIEFEGDIVWVKKMREHNYNTSPKIAACAIKDLQAIPESEIRDIYMEKYDIHIPSIPYRNQTKPNQTQDKPNPVNGRRAKRETNPLSTHPAICAIRELTKRFPPEGLYKDLIEILGDSPDLEKLKTNQAEWQKRGYNPNALTWALDWYRDGIPKRQNGGSGKSQRTSAEIVADELRKMGEHGN